MKFSERVNEIVRKNKGINKKQLACKLNCAAKTLNKGLHELEKDGKVEVAVLYGVRGNPNLVFPKGKVPKQVKNSKTYYQKAEDYLKKNGPTRSYDLAKAIGIESKELFPHLIGNKNAEKNLCSWKSYSEEDGTNKKRFIYMYGLKSQKPSNPQLSLGKDFVIESKTKIEELLKDNKPRTYQDLAIAFGMKTKTEISSLVRMLEKEGKVVVQKPTGPKKGRLPYLVSSRVNKPKKQLQFNFSPKKKEAYLPVKTETRNDGLPTEGLLEALLGNEIKRMKEVLETEVASYVSKLETIYEGLKR